MLTFNLFFLCVLKSWWNVGGDHLQYTHRLPRIGSQGPYYSGRQLQVDACMEYEAIKEYQYKILIIIFLKKNGRNVPVPSAIVWLDLYN
ncbi:hypothetical protein DFH27DRAFT_544668 [Peziza echinospora]|nr:hypothetical protein DFH27DRAFT_544668 [Peziza echinospora]